MRPGQQLVHRLRQRRPRLPAGLIDLFHGNLPRRRIAKCLIAEDQQLTDG